MIMSGLLQKIGNLSNYKKTKRQGMAEGAEGEIEKVLRKSAERTIKRLLQIYKGLNFEVTKVDAEKIVFVTEKGFAHRLEKQLSDFAENKFVFLFEKKRGGEKLKICSLSGKNSLLRFVGALHTIIEETLTPDKRCTKIHKEFEPLVKKHLGEKAVCRCTHSRERGFRVSIGINGKKGNFAYFHNNPKRVKDYVKERIGEIAIIF